MKVKNKRMVEISHVFSESFHVLRKYDWIRRNPAPDHQMMVFMVDDSRFYSGGLADRFKGAVSAFAWCLCNDVDFRIRYTFPFELSDYLLPSDYEWRLADGEFSRNGWDSKVLYARGEHGRRLVNLDTRKQIHYYGNMDVLHVINEHYQKDYKWGELFNRLFRPGEALQKKVDEIKAGIGSSYISAVFRFQNLLGDFEEYHFKSEEDQTKKEVVISRCLDGIKELQKQNDGTYRFIREGTLTVTAVNKFSGLKKSVSVTIRRIIIQLESYRITASGDKNLVSLVYSAKGCDFKDYEFYLVDRRNYTGMIEHTTGKVSGSGMQIAYYSPSAEMVEATVADPVSTLLSRYTVHFIGYINGEKHHVFQNF